MGLIEKHSRKPFREIHPAVTESDDQVYVGPNWIRTGQNVDAPLADAAARREVKAELPPVVTGRTLLAWCLICLSVALLLGAIIWKGMQP